MHSRTVVLSGLVSLVALGVAGGTRAVAHTSPLPRAIGLRVGSAVPGREVQVRGVLLVSGEPMRVVEQATPFHFQAEAGVVFAAFEPQQPSDTLTLDVQWARPGAATVTAHRVMMGHQIGTPAGAFVQGY